MRGLERVGDDLILADVQRSRLYSVELRLDGDNVLAVRCDCPWFDSNGEECKHIWAAIRAAGARGMLPERELTIDVDDDFVAPVRSFRGGRASRPQSQTFLDSLGVGGGLTSPRSC